MKTAIKRISVAAIGLILLVLVLAAGFSAGLKYHFHPSAPRPHYPPAADALEAQRQDLRYFRQLIALDRSFEPTNRTEATRRLDALEALSTVLDRPHLHVALMQIDALADNGHSRIENEGRAAHLELPVRLAAFSDGLYIMRATEINADLLGGRGTAVDGQAIDPVMAKLEQLRGGTPQWRRLLASQYLTQQELLYGIDVAPDTRHSTWTVETPAGAVITRRLDAYAPPASEPAIPVTRWLSSESLRGMEGQWRAVEPDLLLPIALIDFDKPFRSLTLPGTCVQFVQFKSNSDQGGRRIGEFVSSTQRQLRQIQPCSVIVDLRYDGGGDYMNTYGFAHDLPKLIPPGGRIIVLTGPATFSAGISTAAAVKHAGQARVVIVGEPVGDRLRFYSEGGSACLPNSPLCVAYETGKHDYQHACTDWDVCFWLNYFFSFQVRSLDPDEVIPLSFSDWRSGVEPVLDRAIILATAGNGAGDPPPAALSIEELRQQLANILRETHTPGMAGAIVHRDGPEWVAGLGQADSTAERNASRETLFRIGSTSKAFVALSILKLVNEGKLSLQDSVHKLAPEVWFENPWEASDPVHVVDLLEHTTGWDDIHLREVAKDAPGISLREALDYDHHSRISRWRPGTRMAYCNSGPAVAAYIVEKISGRRFEDYVTQNFFEPIGTNTATYFQPTSAVLTHLYRPDGKTPYLYWNILFRPAGSINASAQDMAAFVQFLLNRGTAQGRQVMPSVSIDRMEHPTRTWAAQQGLSAGYGLSTYESIHDGFVYHGHNGGVQGGLTDMAYMPDYGVGYFYSINAGNTAAFSAIGKSIRAYVTHRLQRPPVPGVVAMPAHDSSYAGWYEPDSPRVELNHPLERLLGIVRIRFADNELLLSSLRERGQVFLPMAAGQFRKVPKEGFPDPIATIALLSPNAEGQFVQMEGGKVTMKRIPAWFAIAEIALIAWFVCAVVSVLCYAPFWLLGGLSRKRRRPAERAVRAWPLVAVLSLVAAAGILILSGDDFISRMGNRSFWSAAVFLSTLLYSVASAAGAVALWRAHRQAIRCRVRKYSIAVIPALLIAAVYLAYWGLI